MDISAANQINSKVTSNSACDWSGTTSALSYTANGQNQMTADGSQTLSYDARGNLTTGSAGAYGYNEVNQITTYGASVTLAFDPLGRLHRAANTRFLYDGQDIIAEYDTNNNLLRHFVHGPGTDEPLVWEEGTGTTNRQWLLANEAGSIIAVTNSAATVTTINAYDEYGAPGSSNVGRFQYTGQAWIPNDDVYLYVDTLHSKYRVNIPSIPSDFSDRLIGRRDSMVVTLAEGAADYFTGTVRIDPLNAPPEPARVSCASPLSRARAATGTPSAWPDAHRHGGLRLDPEGETIVEIRAGDVI